MHWLQTLDTNLFLFVNRSLVNPFFDWLMPILSGGGGFKNGFLAVAILAGIAMFVFGKSRARICVLMLPLIVGTNDGLVCNTLKHAVARPRPFVTLPEARVFGKIGDGYVPPEINADGVDMAAGKGSHNSMPSSHAANCVRRHDGVVPVLPAQPVVHAAAGAGRFVFAHLQRRALSERRAGRRDHRRGLRGGGGHRHRIRVAVFRQKIFSALARKTAVARAEFEFWNSKSR